MDEMTMMCHDAAENTASGLLDTIESQRLENLSLKSELSKWQQPFNQEMFDFAKQQASHKDSLAAQGVYITALEHALKHTQQEISRLHEVGVKSILDFEDKIFLLNQENEQLKQANKDIASAAVEQPPYKADLLQEITELKESLSQTTGELGCWKISHETAVMGINNLMSENKQLKQERDSQQRVAIKVMMENKQLKDMLKRWEWIFRYEKPNDCLECGNTESEGHKPDCELAMLLKGGE